MKAFVFGNSGLRASYVRLDILTQFKWETNAYGHFIHTAFISLTLLCRAQFRGGKQLQTSIIRLQGEFLIDLGCYVMPVRTKQSLTNEVVHCTT